MNDEQIILMFEQRNENAIIETYNKHNAVCRKMASNILANPQDIEECINDALLHAWNSIPPAHPKSLPAFLTIITRNIALDKLKHNSRLKRGGKQVDLLLGELTSCIHTNEDIEETIDDRLLTDTLNRFLRTLSVESRKVFVKRYISMMNVNEIAKQYGFSESKVKSMLMRTRKKLRNFLKEEGWL